MNTSKPRTSRGQFKNGASGNPSGRPIGSRNRATLLAEQLLEGEAEQLTRQLVNLAKKGNIHALRLCLERLIPIRKERSIELQLQPVHHARDIAVNFESILAAAGEGRITPGEAQVLTGILSDQARLCVSVDLERRIQQLEAFRSEVRLYKRQQAFEMQRFTDANKETA